MTLVKPKQLFPISFNYDIVQLQGDILCQTKSKKQW